MEAGDATLDADLTVPPASRGVVLFACGSGSRRHSPRTRAVARALNEAGLAPLLIDLLTAPEEAVDLTTRHLRVDIGLLAQRLVGASTGGGAALVAAARPEKSAPSSPAAAGRTWPGPPSPGIGSSVTWTCRQAADRHRAHRRWHHGCAGRS